MKDKQIDILWSKIEPDQAAHQRMLSNILERAHGGRKPGKVGRGISFSLKTLLVAVAIVMFSATTAFAAYGVGLNAGPDEEIGQLNGIIVALQEENAELNGQVALLEAEVAELKNVMYVLGPLPYKDSILNLAGLSLTGFSAPKDAEQVVSFTVKEPGWLPEGLGLKNVGVVKFQDESYEDFVSLFFSGLKGCDTWFWQSKVSQDFDINHAYGSWAEVTIDGIEAFYSQKGPNGNGKQLDWVQDGVLYSLMGGYNFQFLFAIASSVINPTYEPDPVLLASITPPQDIAKDPNSSKLIFGTGNTKLLDFTLNWYVGHTLPIGAELPYLRYKLDEVAVTLPFSLKTPGYLPQGLVLMPASYQNVTIYGNNAACVTMRWNNPAAPSLHAEEIIFWQYSLGSDYYIEATITDGVSETVMVGGIKATLIKNNANNKLTLCWVEDNVFYVIHDFGQGYNDPNRRYTAQDLIAIAESLR
ncbi:MAG: DUF4367 domain-containing protein [Clostridiales bacterium]|nr:DUF4367 domain-containing protein [Clostridiales bacterium]